jgi:peptidyl-tRNA hydrolase
LGTNQFWRIRIGVDNRNLEKRINGEKYVLEDFTIEEMKILTGNIFPALYNRLIETV